MVSHLLSLEGKQAKSPRELRECDQSERRLTLVNQTPLNVPDNGEVVVTMYRQTDDRKVWYEWMVEVFALEPPAEPLASGLIAPVMSGARAESPGTEGSGRPKTQPSQNSNAGVRRVRVGMSDLHSSIKEGCLM